MVTNTVNFDIRTKTDHNIETQLDFFIYSLSEYQEHYKAAIKRHFCRLLIPKDIGFETGSCAWGYSNNKWKKIGYIDKDWNVFECEVPDAKTI